MVDRQTLMFVIIMFIFFLLPSGSDQPQSSKDRDTLQRFKESLLHSKQELFLLQYELGYGNLTGFKLSYQDNVESRNELLWPFREYSKENPWTEDEKDSILPNVVSRKVKDFWGTDPVAALLEKAYPLNISGSVYGDFHVVPSNIQPFNLQLPAYLKDYYNFYRQVQYDDDKQRYEQDPENNSPPQEIVDKTSRIGNISDYSEGKILLGIKSLDYNFRNKDTAQFAKGSEVHDAVVVTLTVNLNDYPQIDSNELEMYGIYFQTLGALVAVSKSSKFLGNHAMPHLALAEDKFNTSKTLMTQLMNITDIEKDITVDDMNSLIQRSQEMCEYVTYLQLERTDFTTSQLRLIDEELANPQGAPLPRKMPEIEISHALLYSPDCGVVIENQMAKPFVGALTAVTNARLRKMLIAFLVLMCIQLNLVLRQSNRCRTPAQLSNVSSLTVSLLGLEDLIVVIIFLLVSTIKEELYLILACVAVIATVLCYVFELRLLVSVLTTQANERGTTWWEILRGSRGDASETPSTTVAPAPAVEPTVAVNTADIPPLNDETRYPNTIFAIGFTLSIIATFLILSLMLWRSTYRRILEYIGLVGLNSYWIPQFFRNTLKNRRRTILWEFVIGTSLIRVIPLLYLCLNKSNVLRHHYDPILVVVVASWLLFQVFLLYLQDRLGARFWVKDRWLPEQYNYHPLMSVRDLENGFALDILANMKPHSGGEDLAMCDIDCAICMSTLLIPVLAGEGPGKDRAAYDAMLKESMVTPCHHIFHTKCLEDWMVHKLQCPVCRCALPPV